MLTAIQRLQMAAQVNTLMDQQKDAKPMDRLSIAIQINDLMTQLGYGQSATNNGDQSPQKDDNQPAPSPAPENTQAPQIVTDFLAGKYTSATKDAFITALRGVKDYVGTFLSFEDAKDRSQQWLEQSGYLLTIS
ncbi:hypothetical protein [Tatumella sp. OPLPL6]|uniref:hypothetical protein n=1 Tax=Tatumella sp. OPLPL6 TaxID=1928657 RepID=UPI000C17C251|nr:hypothetical protein [Tatumella sp. OPLPL6]PIJ43341.1 hypothetical protein BOM24_09250 [Tatumella sp. OPLPL6]